MIVGVKQSIGIKNTILSKIDRNKIYTAKNQVALKKHVCICARIVISFRKITIIYNPKYEILKRDKMHQSLDYETLTMYQCAA